MARNLGAIQSQPFPVMVALQRAGQKTPTVWSDMPVWIQPGESATPELERAVTELVRRASAQIVDPEVILFLSAVRRALGSHGVDGTLQAVPWMDASARARFEREPATAIVPAMLDYFNGPRCLTRNVVQTDSLPHVRMSSNA
jgi:hypothetical protein